MTAAVKCPDCGEPMQESVLASLPPWCTACRRSDLPSSGSENGNGSAPVVASVRTETLEPPPLGEVLDELAGFVRRFVVMTDAQADAVALWIVHTHAFDAAEQTPYLAISSAEKRSGKTRLLEVLELLVARPWLTGRVTAAVLARKVDAERPDAAARRVRRGVQGREGIRRGAPRAAEHRPPPRREVDRMRRPGRGAVLQGLLHLLREGDRRDREAARHGRRPLAADPAGAAGTRRAGRTVPPPRRRAGGRAPPGRAGAVRRQSR